MYIPFKFARKFTAEIIKSPSNLQIRAKNLISQRNGARKESISWKLIKYAKIKFDRGVIIEISPKINAVIGRVNKKVKKLIHREIEIY